MSLTKYLKGECSQCGGHFEFPVEAIGTVIDCPHCAKPTELMLVAPPDEPGVPRKALFWTLIAVLILGLGLAGSMAALKRAQRLAADRQKERMASESPTTATNTPPGAIELAAQAGFEVSPVTFEKTAGTSLIHAIGTVSNLSSKQRFGVKVELNLFDAAGRKVGATTDYQQVIEPKSKWHFSAPVLDSKAVSATVSLIKEDQ